jgi:phosphoglycolate phosphatase
VTYSTVLFDLDGTLTDSAAGISNSVLHAVAALGMPAPDPTPISALVGPPLRDVLPALGVDAADLDLAVRHYRTYYAERGLYENAVYPGIASLLDGLRERRIRLAVATSKPVVSLPEPSWTAPGQPSTR